MVVIAWGAISHELEITEVIPPFQNLALSISHRRQKNKPIFPLFADIVGRIANVWGVCLLLLVVNNA